MRLLFSALVLFFGIEAKANSVLFGAPVAVTATSSSAQVLAANGLRVYLIIVNTGSVTAYVKFGSVQSGTEGIPIPAGGSYEPIQAPANSVFADTASSTAALVIIEGN